MNGAYHRLSLGFSLFVAGVAAIVVATSACSSKSKVSEAAPAASTETPTADSLVVKYGFRRLSQVALALRAVHDDRSANPGETVLGCSITHAQAADWLVLAQGMAEKSAPQERDAYAMGPRAYSSQFSACAPTCLCSTYADLISRAEPAQASERAFHRDAIAKLRRKAKFLSPRAKEACAREQSWFCQSDLKTYFESLSAPPAK